MMLSIGEKFKQLREESQFTQSQIADYLGVDQSYISMYEKNKRQLSVDLLEKISDLFGYPLEYFIEDNQQYQPLFVAFRTNYINSDDLKTISVINKISLNLNYMNKLALEKNHEKNT